MNRFVKIQFALAVASLVLFPALSFADELGSGSGESIPLEAGDVVIAPDPLQPEPEQSEPAQPVEPVDPSKGVVNGKTARIANGTYFIRSAKRSKLVVEDPNAKASKKTQMRLLAKNGSNAQRFYVRNEGDGLVSIQSVASGLYLGDSSGKVCQLARSSAKNRLWRPVRNGGYAFVNQATGKVLSAAGGKVKSKSKIIARSEIGAPSQRWRLKKTTPIASGYYQVRSAMGTNLDVTGASYAYNANVQAWSRNKSGAQVFHVTRRPNGYYRIENAQSFLVVGVSGSSKARKANVVQVGYTGAASQQWKPVLDRAGGFTLKNRKSGKVLEVAGSSKKPGANVRQNKATGSKGQRWRFRDVDKFSLSGDSSLDRSVASVLRGRGDLASAFNWTVRHSYRNGQRYWSGPRVLSDATTISLAKDFFAYGSGNCYRFASAFNWLARGLGYSTNVISGWVSSTSGGRAPHGWVEVYSGGTRVCDPDLAHEIPGYNWFMCTYSTSPTEYHNW